MQHPSIHLSIAYIDISKYILSFIELRLQNVQISLLKNAKMAKTLFGRYHGNREFARKFLPPVLV